MKESTQPPRPRLDSKLSSAEVSTLRSILPRLVIFREVAGAPSITAAAKQLGISRAATSEAVSSLEDILGCDLLKRSTRSIDLTPAGVELLEHCDDVAAAGLRAIEIAQWHTSEPRGTLRISCGGGFILSSLIAPVAARMLIEHDINIEVHTSARPVDLIAERFDAAIRIGATSDSSLRMKLLGRTSEVIVGAPEWRDKIKTPRDLEAAPFILQRWQRSQLYLYDEEGESSSVRVEPRVTVEDTETFVQVLRTGAGVGMLTELHLKHSGEEIVRLLPNHMLRRVEVYALTTPERWRTAKLRRLLQALSEQWKCLEEGS